MGKISHNRLVDSRPGAAPWWLLAAGIIAFHVPIGGTTSVAEAEEGPSPPTAVGKVAVAATELSWHDDYAVAVAAAKRDKRRLLVYFTPETTADGPSAEQKRFEDSTLRAESLGPLLAEFTLARLPREAKFKFGEQISRVLDLSELAELKGRAGLAMLDFADERGPHFGRAISLVPIAGDKFPDRQMIEVLLTLPAGTLTQRTMIYAIRIHPDRPASTSGELNAALVAAAEKHSRHMAELRLQGHHNWDRRFYELNDQLPNGYCAREVCAESWPGQGLYDSAIECVRSWRHSSGHWSAVSAKHAYFAYDIHRGSNGTWYATGLFGVKP